MSKLPDQEENCVKDSSSILVCFKCLVTLFANLLKDLEFFFTLTAAVECTPNKEVIKQQKQISKAKRQVLI